MEKNAILYISAILPAKSETFVYREIFALRSLGVTVHTASVHASDNSFSVPELVSLSASTIPIYATGIMKLICDAFCESAMHPVRAVTVLMCAVRDLVFAGDVKGIRRARILAQACAALALARRIRHMNVGHIHAHMAHVPATIAMYTARQLGVGFSFTGHANDLFPNRSLLREKIQRAVFVSCISRWHRDFYLSVCTRSLDRFPVIHCGVDTRKEMYIPPVRGKTLKLLGVGRLVGKKGFDLLLDALFSVLQHGPCPLELTIAGSGPEARNLEMQIDRLSLPMEIRMLGAVDNEKVMELMTWCDVLVLPLRITSDGDRDGIPVVLMEAMARGRCVVCGDLVTIRELVDDEESGFFVKPGDVSGLADIIASLANNRSRLDIVGLNARRKIEREFDMQENAKKLRASMFALGVPL